MRMMEYKHPQKALVIQFIYHNEEAYEEAQKILEKTTGDYFQKSNELLDKMKDLIKLLRGGRDD